MLFGMFDGVGDFFSKGILFWVAIIGLICWWNRRSGGLKGIFGDAAADEIKKRVKEKALDMIRKRIGK